MEMLRCVKSHSHLMLYFIEMVSNFLPGIEFKQDLYCYVANILMSGVEL